MVAVVLLPAMVLPFSFVEAYVRLWACCSAFLVTIYPLDSCRYLFLFLLVLFCLSLPMGYPGALVMLG